ncbi:unnamed protein product [Amoebophrya sp. A25]|nr:unnamed protein product [Amoebophrya sp. A25]|eukprot:GSA25T00023648001.1
MPAMGLNESERRKDGKAEIARKIAAARNSEGSNDGASPVSPSAVLLSKFGVFVACLVVIVAATSSWLTLQFSDRGVTPANKAKHDIPVLAKGVHAGFSSEAKRSTQWMPSIPSVLQPVLRIGALAGINEVKGCYERAYDKPFANYWNVNSSTLSHSRSRQEDSSDEYDSDGDDAPLDSSEAGKKKADTGTSSSSATKLFAHNSVGSEDGWQRTHETAFSTLYLIGRRANDILVPPNHPDAKAWPTRVNVANYFRFIPVLVRALAAFLDQKCATAAKHRNKTVAGDYDDPWQERVCRLNMESGLASSKFTPSTEDTPAQMLSMRERLAKFTTETALLFGEAAEFAELHMVEPETAIRFYTSEIVPWSSPQEPSSAKVSASSDSAKIYSDEAVGEVWPKYAIQILHAVRVAGFGEWKGTEHFFNDKNGFRQAMWNFIHSFAAWGGYRYSSGKANKSQFSAMFPSPQGLLNFLDHYVEFMHPCPICRTRWREDGPALFGTIKSFDDLRLGAWVHHNDVNLRIQKGMSNAIEAEDESVPGVMEVRALFASDKRWPSCDMCPSCWKNGVCREPLLSKAPTSDPDDATPTAKADKIDGNAFRQVFDQHQVLSFLESTYK